LESCSETKASRALTAAVEIGSKNPEQQLSTGKDVSTHGKAGLYVE